MKFREMEIHVLKLTFVILEEQQNAQAVIVESDE